MPKGHPAYGLFDERNRLPDPAIEYCAPLDWMEQWLDEHQDIDRYAQEFCRLVSDSIQEWQTVGNDEIPEHVLGPTEGTPVVTDLRARLDRIIPRCSETSAPVDRVKS